MAVTDTLSYQRVTTVGDFFALLKPRVMSLVVFTGLAGLVAAYGAGNDADSADGNCGRSSAGLKILADLTLACWLRIRCRS